MEVYIEVVFIDNFIIDYIILSLCGYQRKVSLVWWRGCLASFLGVVIAVVSVLKIASLVLLFAKIAFSFLIVFVAFGKNGFFPLLANFYIFTFLIGGFAMGVLYLKMGVDFGIFSSVASLPTGVLFGVIFFGYCAAKKIIYIYNTRKTVANFSYNVEIFHAGKTLALSAFLDTGNLLVCSGDLRGVCVGEYLKFLDIFKGDSPQCEVEACLASGSVFMSVYKVQKMVATSFCKAEKSVEHTENHRGCMPEKREFSDVLIALSPSAISKDFSLILPANMFI